MQYLNSESPTESTRYHAASVGLDNADGIYTSPKCLPHQETSTLTLEHSDAFPDLSVQQVMFPGPPDSLQPQETCTHLTSNKNQCVSHIRLYMIMW